MRQLGGSFGVASITTLLSRKTELHRSNLASSLNMNDPDVQGRLSALQHAFMAKGMPSNAALEASYKALNYTVIKQATVLSYMDAFLYLGIMFLICIPLVLLVRNKKGNKVNLAEAMH